MAEMDKTFKDKNIIISGEKKESEPKVDKIKKHQKRGKGAQQRRTDSFRLEKNKQTDAKILAGIYRRLKVTDPTSLQQVPGASTIPVQVAPITFRGIPTFIRELWSTFITIGKRAFDPYKGIESQNRYIRVFLNICEVKVAYAQRTTVLPNTHLPHRCKFTETELFRFRQISEFLPTPLAILLECIGNGAVGDDTFTPMIATENETAFYTFAPSGLHALKSFLVPMPMDERPAALDALIQLLEPTAWVTYPAVDEPGLQHGPLVSLPAGYVERWTAPISEQDLQFFIDVNNTLKERRDYVIQTDITTGFGTSAQLVQFLDKDLYTENRIYSVVKVEHYDMACAVAFRLGDTEETARLSSRYTAGNYDTALQRGTYDPVACRQAVMRLSPN